MNLQANASSVSVRPVGACNYSQPRQLPAKDNLGTFLPDLCDALEEALQRSVRLERKATTQAQTLDAEAWHKSTDRDRTAVCILTAGWDSDPWLNVAVNLLEAPLLFPWQGGSSSAARQQHRHACRKREHGEVRLEV